MHETRFGGLLAQVLSLATRGLGLFLFVVAFAAYRRDPRAIAILAGSAALLVLLLILLVS
ncbi:MAG: hypothetical protein J7500_08225 [Sphingomonas sp.]|uniref:hypothetical protein n=1 Tax=Sphingomonas sp. TaxID=28214 RepID=UPI001B2EF002|nr:hypothetical protein [Sphingomonas sp.]MBO9622685.1 hypothetical protein [Sphingomonas sp.]